MRTDDITKCEKCNTALQTYFEKPEGDYYCIYKRCPECLEIYCIKKEIKYGTNY